MRRLLPALLLAGCTVGPDYQRPPAVGVTAAFKEAPAGWTIARPQDTAARGAWWSVYQDPLLDRLERRVAPSNQTIREYEALYREAQATVDAARAGLSPTLAVSPAVTRAASGGSSSAGFGNRTRTSYSLEATADWSPDVWGRIRRTVESDVAAAQVGAADLAGATLSAQGALATDYFELRGQDALARLLSDTVAAYTRSLRIALNQYRAGITASSDVAAAQAQLDAAQALLVNVGVTRAQYEHAIAVLTGASPAELAIDTGPLATEVPDTPGVVPATLLQRRPDVAAAERTMQQENALIGVQVAAYYPDITLSAVFGYAGNPLGSLIQTANQVWSLGASASETVFEGGLRSAEVRAARAAYEASVASYRQTVLSAFEQVEDDLSTLRILARQADAEARAVRSAQRALQVALNTYQAGTAAYTAVITQQTTLLSDQETALSVQVQRMTTSVALVQALGGGFTAQDLPATEAAAQR